MDKNILLEHSFVPDAGDWFTLSKRISYADNSWKGECLKAVFREGDFLIADVYQRKGGHYGIPLHRAVRYRITIDLRDTVLARISDKYVEHLLGPEQPAEETPAV